MQHRSAGLQSGHPTGAVPDPVPTPNYYHKVLGGNETETVARGLPAGPYTDTDNYMMGEREWNRFNYYGDKIHRSVVSLFTDRSIYRPGPIVFFFFTLYNLFQNIR